MAARTAHIFEEKWRSDDVMLQEEADFSSLLLSENVLNGLKQAGYKKPSPIQLQAIPSGRFGQDLVVQAKSGTGKTLVFSIIALEMLLPIKQTQVIILAPTREIAFQICSVIQVLGSEFCDLNCCTFIGGTPLPEDKEKAQSCQIAVGTPGRMCQLVQNKFLKTNSVRLLVLDEADQFLDKSFQTPVDMIFKSLPTEKQVIATSATYPKKLKKLVNRYFRDPYIARLNENELSLLGMAHYNYFIENAHLALLAYRMKLNILEKILSNVKFSQCLVFCNLVSRVESLCSDIKKWGFSTTYISSAKEQAARLKAIESLKRFKCKVLVSSDVTSRGIDAEHVDLVVNFDAPQFTEVYLHRVGRAGRYGSKGVAITFLTDNDVATFKTIENEGNFKSFILPDPVPENLINMRPDASSKKYLVEESSTDESTTDDDENNIQDENDSFGGAIKQDDIPSNKKGSDNVIQINNDSSNDIALTSANNSTEYGFNTYNCPMENLEEKTVEKDFTIPSSLIQTADSNFHQNSDGKSTSMDEKSDKSEPANSVKSTVLGSVNSCNDLDSEESTKIQCSPTVQNGFSTDIDVENKGNLDNESLKNIYVPISNFVARHEESKNAGNLNCGNNFDSQAEVHNGNIQSSNEKRALTSRDIAHLKNNLNDFYYTVFKSFKEEHIPKSFCEVVEENAFEDKMLSKHDQNDELFKANKSTKESVMLESDLNSVANLDIQKSNEVEHTDSNLGAANESIKQINEEISADEESKTALSSTPKVCGILKGPFYTSIQLSSDSSDEDLPNAHLKNVLMLHKAMRKAEKYKKQAHHSEISNKKDSLSKNRKQTDYLSSQSSTSTSNDIFMFDSAKVHKSKDCSETPSSESLDSTHDFKNTTKLSPNTSKLSKKLSKPSKRSNDLSTSSSEASTSPEPSTSFCKPHRVSQIPFSTSSESTSDTSSTSSSKSSSEDVGYPDQISKQQRRQRSKHSTGSAENVFPTRELNRYKMQQSRHKYTQRNKPNDIRVSNASGNVSPNYSCSRYSTSDVSMPSWGRKNATRGNGACSYGNSHLCGTHCEQYMHSSCFQHSSHECYYKSSCQSQLCNNLYSIFQQQWESIYYSTYFQ